MLKKENRLGSVILKNTKLLTSPLFNIKLAPNSENKNRFAFVVSKRIDKRAVVRNSLKRKVRSCVEQIFDNIVKGFDFVFYPKQAAIIATRDEILAELNKVFSKNQLLR